MTEDVLKVDEAKTAFNARAKASMRAYLKSRTWPEKIESIERMNEAARLAREGMRRAGNKRSREREDGWASLLLPKPKCEGPRRSGGDLPIGSIRKGTGSVDRRDGRLFASLAILC